jgi:Kef-type K+ transport system membrane component KefB
MESSLLVLGALLVTGLAAGLCAARFGLPRVAAYVVAGIVFSPGVLGDRLGFVVGEWTAPLTTAALGIIAYMIGGSITVRQLRRLGRVIAWSTLGEALGASVVVFFAVLALRPPAAIPILTLALAFGAIAASTDPASTIAVLHQYRARGPLGTMLLGVAALDDPLGIVLYSLMLATTVGLGFSAGLAAAAGSIGGGLLLGAVAGAALAGAARRLREATFRLPLALGAVLLVVGLGERLGASPILAAMALGFAARHFSRGAADRLLGPVEFLEETVFVVFFTLAGAQFRVDVLATNLALVVTYVVARVIGKLGGAALGARLGGAPPVVRRWLGLGLVTQAGIAVGLSLMLAQLPAFRPAGAVIVNTVLAATMIYEVVGPLTARFALDRAGELGPKRGREGA